MIGMAMGTVRPSALTTAGVYVFLFFLFLWPFVDLASTAWPFLPGSLQWRFGFLGLLTAYWHTPILAVILGMFLALFLGHRKTMAGISLLCFLWALAILVILVLFPLDVIQIRSTTSEENRAVLQTGGILSELKHLTALITVSLLGLGGWRTARKIKKKERNPESSERTAEALKAQQRD
jgi:hypothetical protein